MSTVSTKHLPESYVQEGLYQYYASGKFKSLKLGNAQTINYYYNTRDWLTSLASTQFWEHLGYEQISEVGSQYSSLPQYTGNISWNSYYMSQTPFTDPVTHNTGNIVGYAYSYDNDNRLKTAKFGFEINNQSWTTTYGSYWIPGINYDKKGNITSLQRDGSGTSLQDNLTYTYTTGTNRLASLSGTSPTTYTYDDNGNVIGDSHRGILFAIYDADNLPVWIYKTNGESQYYTYDLNGNRIRKTIAGSTDRFYFNGIDGKTEAVCLLPYSSNLTYNIWGNNDNIGQVRVQNNSVTGRYYYLKDHLGNIKMTVNTSGTPLSWDDYYPFGSIMSGRSANNSGIDGRYKFTGKERDIAINGAETGYDYFGARYYDSWLGRWMQIDPLAEKYPGWSPYNYDLNNAVNNFDPDGLEVKGYTERLNSKSNYGVIPTIEKTMASIVGARHSYLRITTDKEDVLLELLGNDHGPGFIENNQKGSEYTKDRMGILEFKVYSPVGSHDYSFENKILEIVQVMKKILPDYDAVTANSNGFIKFLVEEAGGNLDLPDFAYFSSTDKYKKVYHDYLSQLKPINTYEHKYLSPRNVPYSYDPISGEQLYNK